jgi:hypothetical protein
MEVSAGKRDEVGIRAQSWIPRSIYRNPPFSTAHFLTKAPQSLCNRIMRGGLDSLFWRGPGLMERRSRGPSWDPVARSGMRRRTEAGGQTTEVRGQRLDGTPKLQTPNPKLQTPNSKLRTPRRPDAFSAFITPGDFASCEPWMERWQSGLSRRTRNAECRKAPWVRIPPSPPFSRSENGGAGPVGLILHVRPPRPLCLGGCSREKSAPPIRPVAWHLLLALGSRRGRPLFL